MQSAFIIRNMDSTPEPQSPNMAATAKRRYRKCTHCTSQMPSITYDNHTICTKCRKQVCDITLVCAECRDWPLSKRQVFVDYNNSLRVKRESKQRQLRLAAAYASDQSVYETDTDVPVDEPSVPVQNVHVDRLNLGQQKCLVSEEIVVSAGTSTETETSNFLSLTTGEGIDKVVLSLLARITDLEATRGLQPLVQNQQITNENNQQAVISPNVCQPAVQSQSTGSDLSQQGVILPSVCQPSVENQSIGSAINQQSFILPNVCQPSAQTGIRLVNRDLFCLMSVNPFLLMQRWRGSPTPLHCFLTQFNRFSDYPQHLYLTTRYRRAALYLTTRCRRAAPTKRVSKPYKRHSHPHSERLLHLAIKASVHINPFWTLPNRLPRI